MRKLILHFIVMSPMFAGCGDGPTQVPDNPTNGNGSAPDDEDFVPAAFTFGAEFGYDPAVGPIATVVNGEAIPPIMYFELLNEEAWEQLNAGQAPGDEGRCIVGLLPSDVASADWDQTDTVEDEDVDVHHRGFTFSEYDQGTTCALDFDVASTLRALAGTDGDVLVQIGVGTLRPDVSDAIRAAGATDEQLALILGAGINVVSIDEVSADAYEGGDFAYGWTLDDDDVMVGTNPVDAATLLGDDDLVDRGYFAVKSAFYYEL